MSEFFGQLQDKHIAMLEAAPVFFVATAPREGGRINLSPKGLDSLRALAPDRLAYLDLTGSGNETAAHLLDNGRITLMVCAFDAAALILRVYGSGRSVQPADAEWEGLAARFTLLPGTRQIFVIDVESVQTSCGWGVPKMAFERERETLVKYAVNKGIEGIAPRYPKNRASIDGLPTGLKELREG